MNRIEDLMNLAPVIPVLVIDEVAHARKRLAGNGNPLLVFESLFCALIS